MRPPEHEIVPVAFFCPETFANSFVSKCDIIPLMNTYIATFFMHFGSIRYERLCKSKGYQARTMPVPRNLSSSCGTCVKYTAPEPLYDPAHDEMETMVICNDDGSYTTIYRAEGL